MYKTLRFYFKFHTIGNMFFIFCTTISMIEKKRGYKRESQTVPQRINDKLHRKRNCTRTQHVHVTTRSLLLTSGDIFGGTELNPRWVVDDLIVRSEITNV